MLEKSLKNAFVDIQKLEVSLTKSQTSSAQPQEKPLQNSRALNNGTINNGQTTSNAENVKQQNLKEDFFEDDINKKLEEYMLNSSLPIKFVRVGEGVYTFGSKKVYVKMLNGRLIIRIGGGYMFIEQFIKMYANHETNQLKQSKENQIEFTDLNEEEVLKNAATQKMLLHSEVERDTLMREIENGEVAQIAILGKPSPIKKHLDRLQTVTLQSPHGKAAIVNSQRDERALEKKYSEREPTTPINADRLITIPGDSAQKASKRTSKDIFYDINPGSENKKKSKNKTGTPLNQVSNREGSLTRPMITEACILKNERSPQNASAVRSKNSSTNTSREISPFQKSVTTKNARSKELASGHNAAVNRFNI